MTFFAPRRNRASTGRLTGIVIGLAIAALVTAPAVWAQHEHGVSHGTHVVTCAHGDEGCSHAKAMKIVMAGGGGMHHFGGDDVDAIDISDMEIGETRYETVGDGTEISITREEDGYVLDIDGEEVRVGSLGEGGQVKLFVADGEAGLFSMAHGGSWTSDDDHVMRLGDGHMAFGGHSAFMGGHGGVTISGLGDLDEDARERIIDALRDAGVEKDIHFGGHGFQVITAGEGDGNAFFFTGDGDESGTMDVDVTVRKLIHEGDGDGKKIIIIKRIKTSDEE